MSREVKIPGSRDELSLNDLVYLEDHRLLPEGWEPPTDEERAELARTEGGSLPPEEDEDDATDTSYEDLTVKELKSLLRRRDLPVSGTHDELVLRLEYDDDEDDSDDGTEPDED